MVDQSPIGRNPRSNPATYTKLADIIRDLFATVTGLSPSHFSFNRPEGACPTCGGLGAVEVAMRYLPSTWIPCADCDGQRFTDEVLAAQDAGWRSAIVSIADFYDLSIAEVPVISSPAKLACPKAKRQPRSTILEALCEIGLGYLRLGQPSPTLSGGEAQRVKLARYAGKEVPGPRPAGAGRTFHRAAPAGSGRPAGRAAATGEGRRDHRGGGTQHRRDACRRLDGRPGAGGGAAGRAAALCRSPGRVAGSVPDHRRRRRCAARTTCVPFHSRGGKGLGRVERGVSPSAERASTTCGTWMWISPKAN